MESTAPKICTVCGLDCSNKPRAKDAQGRYVCKECMQRAQAAQVAKQDAGKPKAAAGGAPVVGAVGGAARSAGDQGDNAFILDIVEPPKVREDQKPCPSCGKGINEGQVLCTSCGFNLKTGERALVNVLKPVEVRDRTERNRSGGGGMNIPEWVFGVVPALAIWGTIIAGMQTENPSLVLAGVGIHLLFGITTFVTGVVIAFKEDDSSAGFIMLGSIVCGFLGLYTLYWVVAKSDSMVLKWMYAVAVLSGIGVFMLQMSQPELFAFE